jgi:hypothetical protein
MLAGPTRGHTVLPDTEIGFQAGSQSGRSLAVELFGPHLRLGGNVSLGAYVRLSDLLNLHDQTLAVADAVVMDRTGKKTGDAASTLDVRLDTISFVIDHSGYVPPTPAEELDIPKKSHKLIAITEAYVITGTFFIYPSAEPRAYLLAYEPKWIPLTGMRARSLIDPSIEHTADFGVLKRSSVSASSVVDATSATDEVTAP